MRLANHFREYFSDRFVPVSLSVVDGKKKAIFPKEWTTTTFKNYDAENSIALKTGNGLTVIDIDTKNIADIDEPYLRKFISKTLKKKDTFIVETTHGYHIYLEAKDSMYSNSVRISPFIDIRSENGCVFIHSKVKGLSYRIISNKRPKKANGKLLTFLAAAKEVFPYDYNERGQKTHLKKREPNAALFDAVNSGDIQRILKTCGMKANDFESGKLYISFNRFAFILASEPSIRNEDVPNILSLLIEDVLGFDPESSESKRHIKQSLNNMIWAAQYIEPTSTDIEVYLHNNNYIVINNSAIYYDLNCSSAKIHYLKTGKDGKNFSNDINIANKIDTLIDFFHPSTHTFQYGVLTISTNPIDDWDTNIDFDEQLIYDFEHKIMGGILQDIIELIVFTMKYHESKLNKLLLVGASNKGKTHFANILGFVEMTAKEFVNCLNGGKWSKEQSQALQQSGLLLADDIEHDLPLGIKNIKDSMHIDIMYRGTIVHPLKFLMMTSTHDNIATTMNEEMKNRILIANIGTDYTLNDSPFYQDDMEKYLLHTTAYMKSLMVKAIKSEEGSEKLRVLQNKFRAPQYNDRDEILEIATTRICDELLTNIDVVHVKGKHLIRRKTVVKNLIRNVLKEEFDGHRIDLSKESSFLMSKFVSEHQDVTIREGGKPVKYYTLSID